MNILQRPLTSLTDNELLDLLEFVSGEIKRRNSLMAVSSDSPEEAAKKIVEALFPKTDG
jgi:hypothetical protein